MMRKEGKREKGKGTREKGQGKKEKGKWKREKEERKRENGERRRDKGKGIREKGQGKRDKGKGTREKGKGKRENGEGKTEKGKGTREKEEGKREKGKILIFSNISFFFESRVADRKERGREVFVLKKNIDFKCCFFGELGSGCECRVADDGKREKGKREGWVFYFLNNCFF